MNTNRRTFLVGALAAAVLPQCASELLCHEPVYAEDLESKDIEIAERSTEFPVLILELGDKYPGEEGPQFVIHLTSHQQVTVNLEDEEDWGDLNMFWDGSDMAWGLGNDVDGYRKIERVYEIHDQLVEIHGDEFSIPYEVTFAKLGALMDKRIASWT